MIRNLLFDLGGVIMDIERERCVNAFRQLGMDNIGDFLGDYGQKGAFGQLEEGLISPAEWREEVRRNIPHEVTDAQIDEAFNSFLIGIPIHRLEALRELHKHYRLYLLSNTNSVMWNSKIAESFTAEGLTVNDYFDGITTSFEAKAMKPAPEIFRKVADDYAILPEETIFFDDSPANCKSAGELGFQYIHVAPGTEFKALLGEKISRDSN
ncbi:HAD family hydrolase [Muribaculum intestinale]|uniref:HAD family hydrolase n=1 Tax=Muribaculum intestinale TaxID=1796646 RepID=UPI0014351B57|nr:HAD family phosphatase [Muribaculum intestinale]GFI66961.1 D-ribitol-5-phosphate phosphatase [Muribaculaceae bacterium]